MRVDEIQYERDNWFNKTASLITTTKEGSRIDSLIAIFKLQKILKSI